MSVALCISLLPVSAFCSAEGEEAAADAAQLYLAEDFNDIDVGSMPTGTIGINTKENIAQVAEIPSKENKSLMFDVISSTDMHMDTTFSTPLTGKIFFDFKINLADFGNTKKTFYMRSSDNQDIFTIQFLSNGSLVLYDGKFVCRYNTGKFYRVGIALDLDAKTMDVYFNGKRRIEGYPLQREISDVKMMRIHMNDVYEPSKMYIDDFLVYSGKSQMDREELEASAVVEQGGTAITTISEQSALQRMENAIAMYPGRPKAVADGRVVSIGGESRITPLMTESGVMVPLRFVFESLGGKVGWDDGTATVAIHTDTFEIQPGTAEIKVNGAGRKLASDIFLKDGVLFMSPQDIASLLDMNVFSDESGLVILSPQDVQFSWENDLALINKVVSLFLYDDCTGEEVVAMIKQRHPGQSHPRILVQEDTFKKIAENIKTDRVLAEIYTGVKARADAILDQPINVYEKPDGLRLLEVSRSVLDRVTTLAAIYNITGEEQYALRAWMELYMAASFPDWNPYHFLDTAEMSAAFAIGYDWLYNWMDASQRETLRTAIVEKGLKQGLDDYENNPRSRTSKFTELMNNWRFVGNGGMIMAAAAIADEEEELCGQIFEYALLNMREPMSLFAPDGSWEEGIVYWHYTMIYLSYMVGTLDSAAGTDFGYFDVPGMRKTPYFLITMNGSKGAFNFHDAEEAKRIPPQLMWLAGKLGDYGVAQQRLDYIAETGASFSGANGVVAEDLIFYDSRFLGSSIEPQLDTYQRGVEVYAMRDGWTEDSAYAAIQCGTNDVPHGQYDMGTFVYDAMGKRFFMDLGADDYNLAGDVQDRYRYRAEGHNTLVINPSNEPGQEWDSTCKIDRFESKPRGAFAVTDMTDAYRNQAESVQRGIMLRDDKETLILQDEIRLKEESDVWWFAHTKANIEISADGKRAALNLEGKTLQCEIVSDIDAVFTVMDAVPLETSPQVEGQNPNANIRKLAIHLENCKDAVITVACYMPSEKGLDEGYTYTVTPLSDWAIEDGPITKAKVDMIYMDGKELFGFKPYTYHYTVELPYDASSIPVISVTGDETVLQADRVNGTAIVHAKSTVGQKPRQYEIKFNTARKVGELDKAKEIKPVSVKASDIPQPENSPPNSIDGDYGTRWSAEGVNWIEYDLGEDTWLECMGVAFYLGNTRRTIYKVELSNDGVNYETVFDGEALGTTLEPERLKIGQTARFVRITCSGFTTGAWNSITEVKFYKEE